MRTQDWGSATNKIRRKTGAQGCKKDIRARASARNEYCGENFMAVMNDFKKILPRAKNYLLFLTNALIRIKLLKLEKSFLKTNNFDPTNVLFVSLV